MASHSVRSKRQGQTSGILDPLQMPLWQVILIALLAIFIGLFFFKLSVDNRPVARPDAKTVNGVLEEAILSERRAELSLQNGSCYHLYAAILDEETENAICGLPKGERVQIVLHPKSEYVVELRTDGKVILPFEETQAAIYRAESSHYLPLAVLVWILSILFLVLRLWYQKSKEAEKRHAAEKRQSMQSRKAGNEGKYRILAECRHEDYEICYRRRKAVNELVVNGYLYDEKKAVLEFPHTLYARIDGHTVEAGLDENSCSFIRFDGDYLECKRRLV